LVAGVGLATTLPHAMHVHALIEAMHRDKKRQGGKLRFVLMRDICDAFVADDVPSTALDKVLISLQPG
jgi:3-dehydroquinate synthetase